MIDYEKLWSGDYNKKKRVTAMPYIAASVFTAHTHLADDGDYPTVIDWGCGQGRSYQRFKDCKVSAIALVDISAIQYVGPPQLFVKGDISDMRLGFTSDFGYCSDVLEHLDPDKLDDALDTIFLHSRIGAFINVCTKPDAWVDTEGNTVELHHTVNPADWWERKLEKYGEILVEGRFKPMNNSFFYVKSNDWGVRGPNSDSNIP